MVICVCGISSFHRGLHCIYSYTPTILVILSQEDHEQEDGVVPMIYKSFRLEMIPVPLRTIVDGTISMPREDSDDSKRFAMILRCETVSAISNT